MLRSVIEDDLPIFFEHQRDQVAISMAAFPSREWDAFLSHWRQNVLGNPGNEAWTILVDDQAAGYVASWEQEGRRLVGYWIGREYWGRGIARSALDEFLGIHEHHRPIHAYVALSNVRSIRVLEKCGFQRVGEPAADSEGVNEVLFQLGDAVSYDSRPDLEGAS
jgi:RimJ/RimL family protein N-acetyltransferase